MRWHPASLMITTWTACVALYMLLPFELVSRSLTFFGFGILFLFIAAFCLGAYLRCPPITQRRAAWIDLPDFTIANRIIVTVAIIAIVSQIYELVTGAGLDLEAAFAIRNERSVGFINGTQSGSSLAFQIGILTSPIGYVAIAKELIFHNRTRYLHLGLFGFGPLVSSALAVGGRGPLLFAIIMSVLAIRTRRFVQLPKETGPESPPKRRVGGIVIGFLVVMLSMNYFVQVFILRAGGAEATEIVLASVGQIWGVGFSGEGARAMTNVIGAGNTYIVFAFSWYLVQGMVISNEVFTRFEGPWMLGLYGNEIFLAIARRLNVDLVVDGFVSLDKLNAYGYLTSAFGALYVDFWYFGIPISAVWGSLAALVYQKSRLSHDGRWTMLVPFFTQGIVFSLINTPLGLANGFVTYIWLMVIFFVSKRRWPPRTNNEPQRPY